MSVDAPDWDDVPEAVALTPRERVMAARLGEFLRHLSTGLSITASAEAAGVSRRTVYDWRDRDQRFAAAWAAAEEEGADRLVDEMRRRAVDGVARKVFYQGEHIDTVREYSDTLLLALAKAKRPEQFRERYDVQQHVNVTVDYAEEIFAARKRAGITIDATPTSVTRTHRSDLTCTDDA